MSKEDIINILKKRHGKKYKKVLRELYEGQLICNNPKGSFYDILKCHRSSKERFGFYHILYKKFEEIIDFSKYNIIDLGCGLNPFSVVFLKNKPRNYYAIDIEEKIIEVLNKYKQNFKSLGINLNIIKEDVIFNLNNLTFKDNNNIIFLFKSILIFNRINKNFINNFKKFIENYGKYAIISVPKFSFSGKRELPTKEKLKKFFNPIYEIEIPNEYFIIVYKD